MSDDLGEGFANTIQITLKQDIEILPVSQGEVVSRLGPQTLDSLIGTLVVFSGPLVIRCVNPEQRIFRIVFQSKLFTQLQPNASLLEANGNVAKVEWGTNLWPPQPFEEGVVDPTID